MTLLIVSVMIVLVVSAIGSLSEAALYAVGVPYIRQLEQDGNLAGRTLAEFKENLERPISAILIANPKKKSPISTNGFVMCSN